MNVWWWQDKCVCKVKVWLLWCFFFALSLSFMRVTRVYANAYGPWAILKMYSRWISTNNLSRGYIILCLVGFNFLYIFLYICSFLCGVDEDNNMMLFWCHDGEGGGWWGGTKHWWRWRCGICGFLCRYSRILSVKIPFLYYFQAENVGLLVEWMQSNLKERGNEISQQSVVLHTQYKIFFNWIKVCTLRYTGTLYKTLWEQIIYWQDIIQKVEIANEQCIMMAINCQSLTSFMASYHHIHTYMCRFAYKTQK